MNSVQFGLFLLQWASEYTNPFNVMECVTVFSGIWNMRVVYFLIHPFLRFIAPDQKGRVISAAPFFMNMGSTLSFRFDE